MDELQLQNDLFLPSLLYIQYICLYKVESVGLMIGYFKTDHEKFLRVQIGPSLY